MENVLENLARVVSKIFLRIILVVLVVFLFSILAKFNKNVVAFAEIVESLNIQEDVESVVDVAKIIENEQNQIDDKSITVSIESDSQYPEGWVKDFNSKLIELQEIFPDGLYWNHMNGTPMNPSMQNNAYSVTDIPCNHSLNGEWYCNAYYGKSDEVYPYKSTSVQCRGFASLLSDYIFGEDAPVRVFENYDELRIGDQARIDGDYHSVFIIDKTDEYVIVAECNEDLESCKISWGRKIMRENMAGWYVSRWTD